MSATTNLLECEKSKESILGNTAPQEESPFARMLENYAKWKANPNRRMGGPYSIGEILTIMFGLDDINSNSQP